MNGIQEKTTEKASDKWKASLLVKWKERASITLGKHDSVRNQDASLQTTQKLLHPFFCPSKHPIAKARAAIRSDHSLQTRQAPFPAIFEQAAFPHPYFSRTFQLWLWLTFSGLCTATASRCSAQSWYAHTSSSIRNGQRQGGPLCAPANGMALKLR